MSEKTKEVGIRLSVKDADVAKRALQAFGKDGEQALRSIENASRKANPSLLALSNGIQRSKEYARDFAIEGARSFLGPVAAIATAAGAVELLRDSMEQVNRVAEQGDLAERIGIALPKLQGLQAAFKESGNDVEELNGALATFGANLQKALSQGGALKDIFDLNKVKITGDTLTDLKTYADLVKNAGSQQERLYLVMQAFGKGSKELNDLLVQGSAGLAKSADEAERLGIALNQADVEKARDVVKQLAEANLKLDAAKEKFGLLIAPAEIATINAFNDALEQTAKLLGAIQNIDIKGIAKIIGRDDGDHPSLFGRNGAVAIDWFGDGKVVTGNADLISPKKVGGGRVLGNIHDEREAAMLAATVGSPRESAGTTKLPIAPDKAAEQAAKRIQDVTDALKLQITNLTETNRQQEINNALSRAHVSAASEQGKAIASLAGAYFDQKQAIDAVNSATALLAQTGEGVFEDLIDGTKSWQDILGDTVKTLEKAVLQAALLGQGPLAGLMGTQAQTSGQTGGALGTLLSGLVGAFTQTPSSSLHAGYNLNANGNVFTGSRDLHSYANSVVTRPTAFKFADGMGIMGEKPGSPGEGILPLLRDSKGRLGVSSVGGDGGRQLALNVQIVRMSGSGQDNASATMQGNLVQLKAFIYDAVAEGGSSPGNPVNRMLRTNFGAQQQVTGR